MQILAKAFFSLFFIVFFAATIIASINYNRKARLIPMVVAVPCLGLAICELILDLTKSRKAREDKEKPSLEDGRRSVIEALNESKPLLNIIAWIVGFTFMVYLFGFLIAIPCFTILFMRFNGESWIVALSCAAGLWIVIYLAFVLAAKSTLYKGLVFRLLAL